MRTPVVSEEAKRIRMLVYMALQIQNINFFLPSLLVPKSIGKYLISGKKSGCEKTNNVHRSVGTLQSHDLAVREKKKGPCNALILHQFQERQRGKNTAENLQSGTNDIRRIYGSLRALMNQPPHHPYLKIPYNKIWEILTHKHSFFFRS